MGDLHSAGFVHRAAAPGIDLGLAQVVEMAVGDTGQTYEAGIAEHRIGAPTELAGRGAGKGVMQGIDLGQKSDILAGVAAWERPGWGPPPVPDPPIVVKLGDQAGHLRPRQAGDLAQVAAQQAFIGLAQPRITELAQGLGGEVVGAVAR